MKRRAWLTPGAVVAGSAGVVSYAAAGPQDGTGTFHSRTQRPVEVHDLAMTGDGGRTLARTGTEPFSLVDVSWTGATTELDGTAQVRTRSAATGEWSGWRTLETEGTRESSEPLWVGLGDGAEARLIAADGVVDRRGAEGT
ncbi:hypothetical protein [Streptomyces capitiformicae]|uniref:Uncharacterized protein n=1 Tax=Streptomyces capitiformicae TaxID=2014920 RepID=A0A919GL10_9ACTN|nr:hypothetical protein [Streptomyces capitiformicae]GHH86423.1 hypothetical protein GCM10017771_23440 [Streptomyces capitiformicae]